MFYKISCKVEEGLLDKSQTNVVQRSNHCHWLFAQRGLLRRSRGAFCFRANTKIICHAPMSAIRWSFELNSHDFSFESTMHSYI